MDKSGSIDFTCDLNCPPFQNNTESSVPYCCRHCVTARHVFVNDANRSLWDKSVGFWSEAGCRLDRADMPVECRQYNCHDDEFVQWEFHFRRIIWDGTGWNGPVGSNVGSAHIDNLEDIWPRLKKVTMP
jgi:hypothetical protein